MQRRDDNQRPAREECDTDEEADAETEAVTDDGQPLALEEQLNLGSKSWGENQIDKYEDQFSNFPAASNARTTFSAEKADNEVKFNRFWKLQHGRGHTYEDWDGQRVRQEDIYNYLRARIILSKVTVAETSREKALQSVMSENLNAFSRYYRGAWGAALGFAALAQYDNKQAAKNSDIERVADDILDINGKMLIELVWRKYGGTPP